jgi:hypothetical protein
MEQGYKYASPRICSVPICLKQAPQKKKHNIAHMVYDPHLYEKNIKKIKQQQPLIHFAVCPSELVLSTSSLLF